MRSTGSGSTSTDGTGRTPIGASGPQRSAAGICLSRVAPIADARRRRPSAPERALNELEDWRAGGQAESPLDALIGWDAKAKARLVVADEQLDYGYTIKLPNPAADAPLDGAPGKTTFVSHLRRAFRWGGFPGREQQQHRPERELDALREGLLPL